MLVKVDGASPVPLSEQIAAQIRAAIARAEVRAGERLPPARELGQALGVNMHTVLRAYSALRDEGVIDLRRGRGAVVRDGVDGARLRLHDLARRFTLEATRQGLTDDDIVDLLRRTR